MVKFDYTKDDIRRIAKEENVRFLRLMFTDLYGTIKNVEVPISQLDKVLDNKMMFDGSSIDGFVRIEESDMWLYPDLSTWMIFPWGGEHGKVARLICEVYNADRTPFLGDPRNNLIRVLDEMKEMGFTEFNIGPGVDALLHVSQISRAHVEKPADVLKVGQEITAKVVDLNEEEKKISLSMKALEPAAEEAKEEVAEAE